MYTYIYMYIPTYIHVHVHIYIRTAIYPYDFPSLDKEAHFCIS